MPASPRRSWLTVLSIFLTIPLLRAQAPATASASVPPPTHIETVTVTADTSLVDLVTPDPGEKVFVREQLLDANPGRPGSPVSLPGYPTETASSGIKAPQYFAPGVAGDHGEAIAQFIAVGAFRLPNNLSANAHGNGYADPNLLVPEVIESAQVDGGAYNVQEGNHSVYLAAEYGLRHQLAPFLTLTADQRDVDLVAGFQPARSWWLALEGSIGNGFLDRLEHRQQYKLNTERFFHTAHHEWTLLGIGYYGFSYVPGLVPILHSSPAAFLNVGDTIDPRQKDQTHSALIAINDAWHLTGSQQLSLSGFFRTYNLSLYSNFGQGLIRQSEFRTVTGASATYTNKFSETLALLAGLDFQREAPRRDNLDHYNFYTPGDLTDGPFTRVTSNNVTITPVAPYLAASGTVAHVFRYYAGWQRDQVGINNQDVLHPAQSSNQWAGLNAPKATIAFLPEASWKAPEVFLSYGESFFTEDPRTGSIGGSTGLLATSHSFQLVASKDVRGLDLKLTLGHITSSAQQAKIDPDTGLQFNLGPSRLLFLTSAARKNFQHASWMATFSKADARDLLDGQPTPEAPRTIGDLLGAFDQLPFHMQARGEFEFVGRKPLGTGCLPDPNAQCTGTAVEEFRAAVVRPFLQGRLHAGVNLLLASGFTGQTTENFYPSSIQQVVGVRVPSYASITLTWTPARTP